MKTNVVLSKSNNARSLSTVRCKENFVRWIYRLEFVYEYIFIYIDMLRGSGATRVERIYGGVIVHGNNDNETTKSRR